MFQRPHRDSLWFFFVFFFVGYLFLGLRLVDRQIFQHGRFKHLAASQHYPTLPLTAFRGDIFDRQGKPLALTHLADSLFVVSRQISEKDKTSRALSAKLDLSTEYLLERVRRNKAFVWVKRKLPESQTGEIRRLGLKGVDFRKEPKRVYPGVTLASHALGFVDMDNRGLEGLEQYYDRLLRGEDGFRQVLRDAKQRALASSELKYQKPVNGSDLILTLDEVIQHIAERELDEAVRKWQAEGAAIIVMDPHNGEILALANRPSFDLNEPGETLPERRRNRAITDLFEPGSVFKMITAAAALQEGIVNEEDRIYCENGTYRISNHTLHDVHPYGVLSFQEVIQKSSNIGTVKVAQKLGAERLHHYIRTFGFGEKTGIDLPGEVSGTVRHPRQWWGTSIANIPIGQGVSVTALQLACAMGVIANGGSWVKPHLLKEVLSSEGDVIKSYEEEPPRLVLNPSVSKRLQKILVSAIEGGTGKSAKLKGYLAGGKTGTAQKLDANGRYSHSSHIGSFVGFAPYPNPRIVVVVMVDEPRPMYYGGVVAAPVFKKVSEQVLRYLEIPSEENAIEMVSSNDP